MKILFITSLLIATAAARYNSQGPTGSRRSNNAGRNTGVFSGRNTGSSFASSGHRINQGRSSFNQGVNNARNIAAAGSRCRNGEVLHVDGNCVVPKVTRNFFAFTVPKQPRKPGSTPNIPPPTVEHNILFVRLPEGAAGGDPIVVPPPKQNNIVYILKKNSGIDGNVINIPAPPKTNPEVFFVNYNPDENPTLPGGIDLQTALNAASQGTGQVISSSNSNGFQSFNGNAQGGQSGSNNFGTSSSGSIGGSTSGTLASTTFGSGSFGASSSGTVGHSNFGSGLSTSNTFGSGTFAASGPGSVSTSFESISQPSSLYTTP